MSSAPVRQQGRLVRIKVVLAFILGLNLLLWVGSKGFYARWEGVPPAPTEQGALMVSLGDAEFSYRFLAMMLQNLGNVGRDYESLKNYNYPMLGKWFFLLHGLDPASDAVPMIAANYFGATRDPEDAAVLVEYLRVAGAIPVGDKWRWLARAAYLAQYRMKDVQLALKLAYQLANMPNREEMPQWARQMPAFILKKQGDKEAAREMMENMLLTEKNPDPAEVFYMKAFLIEQLGVLPSEVEALMKKRAEMR